MLPLVAARRVTATMAAALFVFLLLKTVKSEILTPPYFNLAEGRKITATATCGEESEGPELYCKLVGANAENDLNVNVIQGQFCDYCDKSRPDKRHPPEYAVDGLETWWQSPPLSRGMKYNEVNLTIDFGQEFHVAYVYIRMGNSPRPGLWILEKSSDYGATYKPWQYFSDSKEDCESHFGLESLQPITRDDSVICVTEYSKIVPLEGGEIPIPLLNNRPSANHYFNSSVLQEWTRATNVRFRFLRTKNLLGHLMSVARQDPTVTRRYFYSIKDISIGGRCMCNGHADTCDIQDPSNPNILLCRCQHNTCGAKCQTCCRGFQQKAWRISKSYKPFICERCNCFEHSNECIYDPDVDAKQLSLDIHGNYEGGGVCQNCQHNTEGINCNRCKGTFYRPYGKYWNETDVCQSCECNFFYSTGNCDEGTGKCECRKEFTPPNCNNCSFGYYDYPNCRPCECYLNGTHSLQCEATNGQCTCLPNYGGKFCKECAPQYYNFPECKHCECNTLGSSNTTCNQTNGYCTCKINYGGKQCDQCQNGYYQFPSCSLCQCSIKGTEPEICNKENGACLCKEGYGGPRCDECIPGYFGYPDCQPCNCTKQGSASSICNTNGVCPCLANFGGRTCEKCSVGNYKFPECLACDCDGHGSMGISCDHEGRCQCQHNFDGNQCNKCREGFYNFPLCEECNCNPAGVAAAFAGCGSVPVGELCQCKERVQGRICDQCKPLYWNLHLNNPEGCEECHCHIPGVLGGNAVCNGETGQCACKPSVQSRSCSECADGTYNLQADSLFGCTDCRCDIGGSLSPICDKVTGQCPCQSRVNGRTCKEPLKAHYFPTLYQYQYEVEDGHTPSHTAVRYAYDENVFQGYSWKGYAVFSPLQNEILQDVYISKPSLYVMVIRYVNSNPEAAAGTIKITPENPIDNEQTSKVNFKTSASPTYVSVLGASGSAFVLNPGHWTVSIQTKQNLLVDYFVLLPEDFYLATILNQNVQEPCVVGENQLCREYSYPNSSDFDMSWGSGGFIFMGGVANSLMHYYDSTEHLYRVGVTTRLPLLNNAQPEITYNVTIRKPGRYVMVVNYVTPLTDKRSHTINVETVAQNGRRGGQIILYSCPYTTVCRQAVTDKQNGIGVHLVDGNSISVTLQGVNASVAIHSVVAVPVEEWSLNYIKPKSVCIRKDGVCITSTFPNPPESKKVQFEQDLEGSNSRIYRTSNSTAYVYLNPAEDMIDLRAKVASPGAYVFVVQYFQPDFPEFELNAILQNGEFYEAKVLVSHCPSPSGCRALIQELTGNTHFSLTENVVLTLKQPNNKRVFLDYLLIIPADLYTPRILEEVTLDRTGEFLSTCGSDFFNIDTSKEGFCRDSVFSITAAHNNGALPCQCDYDGSLSFECDKFGGQCPCKPNIIGRQCGACKTGYYGFPDCKPCNCPSTALCETSSGRCICPTHVTGERCDQCMIFTYGYDPIIGCEECKCHPLGVAKDLQCNLQNGSCTCKDNIVGRACDTCQAGHFAFPYCERCECDTRGTVEEICDQISAECLCKKQVTGPSCGICREGSYNIQKSNPDGCTECFCFGKTTRCVTSTFIQVSLLIMDDWKIVNVNESQSRLDVTPLNLTVVPVDAHTTIGADFTTEDLKNKSVYFSAPRAYLGRKLTAYGGFLNFTIFYTIGLSGKAVSGADVILEGAGTYLLYTSDEQPASAVKYVSNLQLVEGNFYQPNGFPAKREHIMTILQDLRGVYIRAVYWSASVTTSISNVLMDDSVPHQYYNSNTRDLKYATSVEQCQCPPGYNGLSCEDCAPGYYRISSGPHGGYCVPCQCNGHSDECDVYSGVCLNCKHNTKGEHCEFCGTGYHGNALQGTPMDCLICACPLPIPSNNFASACDVSADGEKISCECDEGYFGARCQSCAPGYYGRPEVANDYCKPCQCSGNINPNELGSCDTVSGECLRCLNNTFGETCALCSPGFYGDAIKAKNCQPCVCDQMGTGHCNSYTGLCECKPNVIGEKCDRCEIEHYGFQSGYGCIPCNCSVASLSSQCDDTTGQCRCKPGVAGRACDRCAAGFWNYTHEGCQSCGCKTEYSVGFGCNAQTGHCECLTGVVGEKCDQCPRRWVFVPEVGCHSCDKCIDDLLDMSEELHRIMDPTLYEFDSVDSGYFTTQRLLHINETLNTLRPKVALLDPNSVNLTQLSQRVETLEQQSKNLNKNAVYFSNNSAALVSESDLIKDDALTVLENIREAAQQAMDAISNVDFLSESLMAGEGPKIDSALLEAQNILRNIKLHNLTSYDNDASKQLSKAAVLLNTLREFKQPVDSNEMQFKNAKNELKLFNDKVDDLHNQTLHSLTKAVDAENIYNKTGKDAVTKKLQNVETQSEEIAVQLLASEKLLKNASDYLTAAQNAINGIVDEPKSLETTNTRLNTTLEENYNGIIAIEEILPDVQEHASNLSLRAQELDSLLSETRNISNNAIRAATAYKNIVEAVDEAHNAANIGRSAANNATGVLAEVSEETVTSSALSAELLLSADGAREENTIRLRPRLEEAQAKARPIRSVHQANEDKLNEIEKFLKTPHATSYTFELVNATEIATNADSLAQNTLTNVENGFKQVSEEKKASQYLPNKIQDVKKDIQQAEKHLRTINEKLPEIERSIEMVPKQQERVRVAAENLNEKINMLKQQIALARDVANRIKVGVRFYPNSTLELRNPPNLQDLSTSTHVSGYFRTHDPNGLLFYLGNGVGTNLRRTTSDDYMALEVENGYPVLTADVGNGPQRVANPKRVSDNNWYQFVIDRTANNAKLTIREEAEGGKEELHTESAALPGYYTIFNLDKNKSKLFVGGYPTQFPVQEQVRQHSFNGEIEDLQIGDIPISLWNFNEGKENNHGAVRRDKLVILQPSTGFRFNGNGYAVIDARSFLLRSRSDIKMSFKTFAPNGLLFVVHGSSNKTFISIEIRDGHVLYQYNLGYETKLFYTPKLYNDGNWHVIEASRAGAKGRFVVDGEVIPDNGVNISGNVLETFDTFSFGGYPHFHGLKEVTNVDFDGCIDNVTIGSPIDLSQNIKAYGVIPGCPEKFARLVSFSESKPGYLRSGEFSSNDLLQINLKFKTKSKDGLIMFATDNFRTQGVSLAIFGGRLVLISQKIKLETDDNTYNDNEWHVITITHNITTLRMDIDDYARKVTDSPPPPIRIMYGEIFFGGVPTNYDVPGGMVATTKSFSGCVIDASKNGEIINFASFMEKEGDILGKCVLDEEIGSEYHEVPTLPTIPEIEFVTTKTTAPVTVDRALAEIPKRGDGAWQNSAGKRVTTTTTTTETTLKVVEHVTVANVTVTKSSPVTAAPEKFSPIIHPPTAAPACVLPMIPELDVTLPTTSYKYGGEPYSRSEYNVARGKFRTQFYFNLEFKTTASEGILFYIESPPESQYVAVFLQNGHVIYTFSDGYGSAIMRSDQPYTDGTWHSVNASRSGPAGKLIIDEETVTDLSSSNEIITSTLDLPHYIGVGGIPPTKINEVFKYLNTTATFDGCIKNFRMNDFVMEDPTNFGVTPCSENIEPGAFFGIREGYIKLKEKHKVGLEIDVKLDIKPRNISGVLIAVHGRRDYLVLEMINGVIKLTVDNGKGAISTLFKPDKTHYFCDGQWHSIQAVKSKNVVTLSVDSTFTDPGVGDYRSQSTDTGGALFLGGHRYLSSARGIITRASFVGCIRNVQVNNAPIKLTDKMAAGHVAVGFCPTV